jgi:HEPN domain-containing protein
MGGLDDNKEYKLFFEFEFPHVFSYADTRPGHTDKEKRNLIREYAFEKCPDSTPSNTCWAISISVEYDKKKKRLIDIDNIPKLIIDAFCKKQIRSDKSYKYKKLGLYDDDTIVHINLLEVKGTLGSRDSTKVQVFYMKQYQRDKKEYLSWQNSAVIFYISARLLWLKKIHMSAIFLAIQALENLLKSTLLCYVKDYNPLSSGHNLKKMTNILKNQVKNAKNCNMPSYFYKEMYSIGTRYPDKYAAIYFGGNLINDLDRVFLDLMKLAPQISFLNRILKEKNSNEYKIIKEKNLVIKKLESLVK